MPYTPSYDILKYAQDNHFAYGAFNVNLLCQIDALIEACEELRSDCIIQVAEPALAYFGGNSNFLNGTFEEKKLGAKRVAKYVKALANKSKINVSLHLDHGRSYEVCKMVIDQGFNSVMFDGSSLPLEENIRLTKKVATYAHKKGASCEGELGVLAGQEDHVFSQESTYTNPLTALEFVKKTSCDLLAISYGTKHGAVKGDNVKLRKEIVVATLESLRFEKLDCIIVSHGSSLVPQNIIQDINKLGGEIKGKGVPLEELYQAIKSGISKINIDTDIRLATTRNILEFFKVDHPELQENSKVYPLLVEKKDSFEYRYYLKEYIEDFNNPSCKMRDEAKLLVPLIQKAVKEIVLKSTVVFSSFNPK